MPEKLIDRQWIDIVHPAAPVGSDLLLWLLIIGLIILAGILYYFLWYRHPRLQLRRLVYSLYINAETSTNRKLLMARLEQILCKYHGIVSLAQRTTLNQNWQITLDTLTRYRYQQKQPSLPQTVALLEHCLMLLRTKPSNDVE